MEPMNGSVICGVKGSGMQQTEMSPEKITELLENDPWWKEISEEMDRAWMIHHTDVPDYHKSEVVNALFEYTLIHEEMLKHAEGDPVYVEALSIIGGLKEGDAFPERLFELHDSKVPGALDRINGAAIRLISLLSDPAVKTEASRLWASDRAALAAVDLNNLSPPLYVSTADGRYIIRCLVELQGLDDLYRNYNLHPFSSDEYFPADVWRSKEETITVGVGDVRGRDKYLAYRVYDPLWKQRLERYGPEYVTFRLKWAGGALKGSQMDYLYEQHKAGRDALAVFISIYNDEARIDRLKNAISSCPVTSRYGSLFGEAADCYKEGKFGACSVALLPIIEGIIWEYAWWWQTGHGGLFDRTVTREQYKSFSGFELLKSDGNRAGGRPTVGQLLRQTKFGEEVYFEIVEYLCVELIRERNPVLHGREPGYGNRKKAAALLFVVETLERQITKAFKEQVGKELIQRFAKSEGA
jgi:hypothetical protein